MENIHPWVEHRTHLAMGLNMMASEPLQVGRYGIGGHYKPHFDNDHTGTDDNHQGYYSHVNHSHLINMLSGNRVATILIYLEPV